MLRRKDRNTKKGRMKRPFLLFALFMLVLFFVTSSDSGSLVIDTITSGGKNNSPKIQRVIWAIIQGLLAIVILLAGGPDALLALQSGVISMALSFTFVLILAVFSLFYGMLIEVNFFNIESKSVDNKEL